MHISNSWIICLFVEHRFHFIVIWKCTILKSTCICREKKFLLKFWNAQNWNHKRVFENAFACNFCGMLFPSKSHLRMHDLIYHWKYSNICWECFCLQLLWKVVFVKKSSENARLDISLKVLKHLLKMLLIATFVETCFQPKVIWVCTTWYIIVESGSWQNGICEFTDLSHRSFHVLFVVTCFYKSMIWEFTIENNTQQIRIWEIPLKVLLWNFWV